MDNFKKVIKICFLTLLLTELLLRGYFAFTTSRTTIKWFEDTGIGRRLLPNQSGLFVTESKEYKTQIQTNSNGWRDSEHNTEKTEGAFRILILGDSFVENFQVKLEDTFFKKVEEKFNSEGKKIEIVALGLGDTGTAQQYLIFEKYGKAYKPDLVLHLLFTGNDIKNNSPILNGDPHRPYFELDNNNLKGITYTPRNNSFLKFIKENSRLVELLLNAKGKFLAKKPSDYPIDYHIYDQTYSADYEAAWEVTKKLILQTKQQVEAIGARYILISSANNEQINSGLWTQIKHVYPKLQSAQLDLEKPDKILSAFCEEHSINCQFLLPYFLEFKKNNPEVLTHFPYDGHWTGAGTNLVADFIFTHITF